MATFEYTVHCCSGLLAGKIGSNLLLRRAVRPTPLVVSLVLTHAILKITSDGLSKILSAYGGRLRKNASKTQKIRSISELSVVKDAVPKEKLDELLKLCDELDEARRKKSAREDDTDDSDDNTDATRIHLLKKSCPSYLPKESCSFESSFQVLCTKFDKQGFQAAESRRSCYASGT